MFTRRQGKPENRRKAITKARRCDRVATPHAGKARRCIWHTRDRVDAPRRADVARARSARRRRRIVTAQVHHSVQAPWRNWRRIGSQAHRLVVRIHPEPLSAALVYWQHPSLSQTDSGFDSCVQLTILAFCVVFWGGFGGVFLWLEGGVHELRHRERQHRDLPRDLGCVGGWHGAARRDHQHRTPGGRAVSMTPAST